MRSIDLTNQVAVVTGAARGLGRAHALALARHGAQVVAIDVLDSSEVVEAIEAEGGKAVQGQADLAQADAGEQVLEVALEAYGDLDILVNNAGVLRDRMSFNISAADWELVLAVNLSASFYLSRAAVRHWRDRGRGGAIVNTSSESGLYGNAGQANYATAKAGVAAMTVTMATELDRLGIRVNAIAPRARTQMSDGVLGELPRGDGFDPFGAEHVAEVVTWLVSDAAAGVTGQVLVVHGGGIEVMRTWSTRRQLARRGAWTEAELAGLRERLFPDGETRGLAEPVGALFVSPADEKESNSDVASG
jgi:3-oxoacyl-[acyl-carrier protein] reductase